MNAVPTNNKEKMDCQKILSPQELHQVIIGPPLVDFGKVCLRSTSRRDISIVNNLDTYIHIIVQVVHAKSIPVANKIILSVGY